MDGKVAMQLALISERVEQLVELDIAAFAYQERHHDEIFIASDRCTKCANSI